MNEQTDGWMDRLKYGHTDRLTNTWIDGWTEGQMDARTVEWMDRLTYSQTDRLTDRWNYGRID
jgi:hypothetical protein